MQVNQFLSPKQVTGILQVHQYPLQQVVVVLHIVKAYLELGVLKDPVYQCPPKVCVTDMKKIQKMIILGTKDLWKGLKAHSRLPVTRNPKNLKLGGLHHVQVSFHFVLYKLLIYFKSPLS